MAVYKVKHIPTGYFIQPSNSSNWNSNIGKKGKIYEGNNIWTRIQNGNEYRYIEVHEGYGIYKELSERFPDNVNYDKCHYRNRVKIQAKPEDFEQVFL